LTINSPPAIAGDYEIGRALFGPRSFNVTADVVYTPNLNGTPVNPGDFIGKIALIQRGVVNFSTKAFAAQNAGAVGVIIWNNLPFPPVIPMAGGGVPEQYQVRIPVLMVSLVDGQIIFDNLPNVNATMISDKIKDFNGNIMLPTGGINKNFNYNVVPTTVDNANPRRLLPLVTGVVPGRQCHKRYGDNPATSFIEGSYNLGIINMYDTNTRHLGVIKVLPSMLSGSYYPEQAGTAPVPTPVAQGSVDSILFLTYHEFTHATEMAVGSLEMTSVEAMATAIECDPSANNGTISAFRPEFWFNMIGGITRGGYSPMIPDLQLASPTRSYGLSYFWTYMAEQFDPNHQVMRRVNDILGSLNTFNLFSENIIRTFKGSLLPVNIVLKQALAELYQIDIRDLWHDFGTMQVLLRNNTSIPSKYRFQYPFWLFSKKYDGYPQVLSTLTSVGVPQYADFWDVIVENRPIPPNMIAPIIRSPMRPFMAGETFMRTLPANAIINTVDLTNYSFSVPPSTGFININVTKGQWKFSLLQFTSDGTSVGNFIIDGPYYIENAGTLKLPVASRVPSFTAEGIIYLVCSCVSVTDLGGLENYLGTAVQSGSLNLFTTLSESEKITEEPVIYNSSLLEATNIEESLNTKDNIFELEKI
jgi:hypothetical protein